MPSPKLEEVIKLLESGEQFSLTDSQYKKKTGLNIPKNNTYLVKKSAVARKAKEYGYKLVLQERTILFEKE
ncbi:MAG: hypothetical protein K2J37_00140 [Ruminococcus sp.]|nr:hypothetical protein [Ruminococcus sp.]